MTSFEEAATFNLGAVVKETGINADTLRAWERRYGLPQPERTEGGHRIYSQHDIKLVKWLLERQEEGMRIGQAVELWQEMKRAGKDPFQEKPLRPERPDRFPGWAAEWEGMGNQDMLDQLRQAWLEAALDFEETRADNIFSEALARFPVEVASFEILMEGLQEVGQRWFQGKISVQIEHFATSLAIRRIEALIAGLPPALREERIVIACPPHERHVFTPLLITLILRREGYPVVYLGADVPYRDLEDVIRETSSNLVILTAQTLHAAGELSGVAQKLVHDGVPVGYGGGIFNRLPPIRESVPGFYLGEGILNVAQNVKKALDNPSRALSPRKEIPPQYRDMSQLLARVEGQVGERLQSWGVEVSIDSDDLTVAVDNLLHGIQGALALGDMEYADSEFNWVIEFLGQRGLQDGEVHEFFLEVVAALDDTAGEEGEEVITWLEKKHTNV